MIDQVAAQAARRRTSHRCSPRSASFPSEIPLRIRTGCVPQARSAYAEQFVPSWKRLESFLRDTYLTQARAQIGVTTRCPSGRTGVRQPDPWLHDDADRRRARFTSSGLKEVARIEGEMGRVAREAGFTGTVAEFERRLGERSGDALREPGGDAAVRA